MPPRARPYWYNVRVSLAPRGKAFRKFKLKNAFTFQGLDGTSTGPFSFVITDRTKGYNFGKLQQFVPDFAIPYTFDKGSVVSIEVTNLHPAANIVAFTLVGSEIIAPCPPPTHATPHR